MSYRIYAEKPALSFCVSRLNVIMAIFYAIKLIRIGMKVTIENEGRI